MNYYGKPNKMDLVSDPAGSLFQFYNAYYCAANLDCSCACILEKSSKGNIYSMYSIALEESFISTIDNQKDQLVVLDQIKPEPLWKQK